MEMENMPSAETVAAWWGAIVATAVAIYTFYFRWRDETVRFSVRAVSEAATVPQDDFPAVKIELRNIGKRAATVSEVLILDVSEHPPELIGSIFHSERELPVALQPGDYWIGYADIALSKWIEEHPASRARVSIRHGHSEKDIRLPIQLERRFL